VDGILLPPNDLQEGESIVISDGAFADFTGTIEKILSSERIRILFDFMGQETRVDVATGHVERSAEIGHQRCGTTWFPR
jgi:transcription antitermination factor NusG